MKEIYLFSFLFVLFNFVSNLLARLSFVEKVAGHWIAVLGLGIFGLFLNGITDWSFGDLLNFNDSNKVFILGFLVINLASSLDFYIHDFRDGLHKAILFSFSFLLVGSQDYLNFFLSYNLLKLSVEFVLYHKGSDLTLGEIIKSLNKLVFDNFVLIMAIIFFYLGSGSPRFDEFRYQNYEYSFVGVVLFLFWILISLGIEPFTFEFNKKNLGKDIRSWFSFKNLYLAPICYKSLEMLYLQLNDLPLNYQNHFLFLLQSILIIGSVWSAFKIFNERSLPGYLFRCVQLNFLWSFVFLFSASIRDNSLVLIGILLINIFFPFVVLQLSRDINRYKSSERIFPGNSLITWLALSFSLLSLSGMPFSFVFSGFYALLQESISELGIFTILAFSFMGFIKLVRAFEIMFYPQNYAEMEKDADVRVEKRINHLLYFAVACCVIIVGVFPSLISL